MKINKEQIENEIKQWENFYQNHDNLAINILADVLAHYTKEEREELISKVDETLESVKNPINGEIMFDSIKGDIESFERINDEALVALRTLKWITEIEERD